MPAPIETGSPPVAEPVVPVVKKRPRRLWAGAVCIGWLMVLDLFMPRITPPGFPTGLDFLLMMLVPVVALILACTTSMPGWSIGLYGLLCATVFLRGQFFDRRLRFYLEEPCGVETFLVKWALYFFSTWLLCRLTVLLRA